MTAPVIDRNFMVDIPCVDCGKLRHVRANRTGRTGRCKSCNGVANGQHRWKAVDHPPPLMLECRSCHQLREWRWEGLKAWRRKVMQRCRACTMATWVLPSDEEAADWQDFDVDWAVVARFVQGKGRAIRSNRWERQLAVVILTRRGWGAERIAEHMGVTIRTVVRLRAWQRKMPLTTPIAA